MLNLKELSERYRDVGLGYIRFGGHSYYEIDSDIPLNLNSYGGKSGFILNDKQEVQLYYIGTDNKYYFNDKEVTYDKYCELEDSEMYDDVSFEIKTDYNECFGKNLDKYFPHPWFPNKKIISFELVNDIPGFRKGRTFNLIEKQIRPAFTVFYTVDECLQLPEFFKPIYNE